MDRRKFFKKLFQSSAVVAAVPLVLPAKLPSKPKIEAVAVYAKNHDFSIRIDGTEVSHLCKHFEITHGFDYPYKLKVDFEGKLPYTLIATSDTDISHCIEITSRGVKYFDCKVQLKDWIVGWDGKYHNPLVTHAEFYVQQPVRPVIQGEICSIDDFDDKLQAALEKLNRRGYIK